MWIVVLLQTRCFVIWQAEACRPVCWLQLLLHQRRRQRLLAIATVRDPGRLPCGRGCPLPWSSSGWVCHAPLQVRKVLLRHIGKACHLLWMWRSMQLRPWRCKSPAALSQLPLLLLRLLLPRRRRHGRQLTVWYEVRRHGPQYGWRGAGDAATYQQGVVGKCSRRWRQQMLLLNKSQRLRRTVLTGSLPSFNHQEEARSILRWIRGEAMQHLLACSCPVQAQLHTKLRDCHSRQWYSCWQVAHLYRYDDAPHLVNVS